VAATPLYADEHEFSEGGSRSAHTRQLKGLMFEFFEAAWGGGFEALKD
jgi:hypothetical protein